MSRRLKWDAIDGSWSIDRGAPMTEQQYEDSITDHMIDNLRESQQIRTRREIAQRKRRRELIYSCMFYLVCGIAIAVFTLVILGAAR